MSIKALAHPPCISGRHGEPKQQKCTVGDISGASSRYPYWLALALAVTARRWSGCLAYCISHSPIPPPTYHSHGIRYAHIAPGPPEKKVTQQHGIVSEALTMRRRSYTPVRQEREAVHTLF